MYHFAIIALLGLVSYGLVHVVEELVPGFGRFHVLTTFTMGVLIALALDYSVFRAYGIAVRETWMGTVGTGLIIGSLGSAWHALLGYLGYETGNDAGRDRHPGRPRMAA